MFNRLLASETRASLIDQCVVSGGNFLTTMVLARLLRPADYGTFSLLFLALFAINTCHTSLVIYPLTLRGASARGRELGEISGSALGHTILLSIPLVVFLSIAGFALHRIDLLVPMILAMLFWQIQETARRTLLAAFRSRDAILPDMLCFVGQAVMLGCLRTTNLQTVFLVIALTSLGAACWQFALIKVSLAHAFSREYDEFAWKVGRFALAGNALNMISLQVPGWTLILLVSPAAVAGYQSLLNLVGIANPIIFSVSNLLIPAVARVAGEGIREARRTVVHYGLRYAALLFPGFISLFVFPHFVMRLVYSASSPYLALSPLLRLFVLAFMLQYLATVVGAYEGGMSRPKTYMWVQVVSTTVLLTAGVWLIRVFGIAGAVEAMFVASAARLATFLLLAWAADRPHFTLPNTNLEPSHE